MEEDVRAPRNTDFGLPRNIPYKTSSQLQTINGNQSYWTGKETIAPDVSVAVISDQYTLTHSSESA